MTISLFTDVLIHSKNPRRRDGVPFLTQSVDWGSPSPGEDWGFPVVRACCLLRCREAHYLVLPAGSEAVASWEADYSAPPASLSLLFLLFLYPVTFVTFEGISRLGGEARAADQLGIGFDRRPEQIDPDIPARLSSGILLG